MKRWKYFVPPPPEPTLDPFEDGLAVLRLHGQVAGHVATTLGAFSTLFSRQQQPWVWFIVVWADGTREHSEEDYRPWTFVREMQSGYFDGPDGVRYEAEWLAEPERTHMWDALGLAHDQF